ncbi:hypothetical protein ARMA_0516 [Ardenticatena maritima]|uniref:G5 domain-containing protein n=1 Tax=Ardenticatena maritima TaxID=872965 RepID=A0A0M8K5G2_9CHLR|nr:G5 domain-containing protein [Ardenticatena maritima]KPL87338.1 hypothetical protein SE16_12740 [Ardenticatena maritima]GAP62093.1 hypothetical protein ARMA_0516 [Ardenticatena maritima]
MKRTWGLLLFMVLLVAGAAACRSTPPPKRVLLEVDGTRRWLTTSAETVADMLAEQGVALGDLDRVEPPSFTLLEDGMRVRVVRVQERFVDEDVPLPYTRETRRDATLPRGEIRVVQLGQVGRERLRWRILSENGVEVSREVASRETLATPQPEIVVLGTLGALEQVPISGTLVYRAGGNAWVMRGNNTPRALTTTGDLDGHVFALSPDGRWLLFTRKPIGGNVGQGGPINSLWLVRTDIVDDEPRYLETDSVLWADWRPCLPQQGRACPPEQYEIGYSTAERTPNPPGWKARNDFWLLSLNGDGTLLTRREIGEPVGAEWYAWWGREWAWSPDGRLAAWGSATALGVLNVATRQHTVLTTFYPYETLAAWVWTPRPAWRSDGEWLAAVVHAPSPRALRPDRSERFDLWLLPMSVSAPPVPIAENVGMWAMPAWSPTALELAYAQAEAPDGSALSRYALMLMDADGSNRRRLFPANDTPGMELPRFVWSPDGEALAAIWQGDLYLVARDGTATPLTATGDVTHLDWR